MTFQSFSVLAPAKINLYLHVTGKRTDGYHTLDSLIAFSNIGDRITFYPADEFSFRIQGPFFQSFTARETDSSQQSGNLVVRAVHSLANLTGRKPDFRIALTKNLPLAAGLGGGSADAAATIWAMMTLWNIPMSLPGLDKMMIDLGADVPACLPSAPVRVTGIGDVMTPVHNLPEIPVVLVNPLKRCPTPDVFRLFEGERKQEIACLGTLVDSSELIDFLKNQDNDLSSPAISIVPDIERIVKLMTQQDGCHLSRMSGSGATVFGLFDNQENARNAAETLALGYPEWWVRTGSINSPARY